MTSADPRSTTPGPRHDQLDDREDQPDDAPLIGYARVSGRIPGDIRDQITALASLGVHSENIHTDMGHSGRPRIQPERAAALAACHPEGTLVVTSLARLASSLGEAADLLKQLIHARITLQIGDRRYDSAGISQLIDALDFTTDIQAELVRLRTAHRLATPPKKSRSGPFALTAIEEELLCELFASGKFRADELSTMFGVGRATVYRVSTPKGASSRDADTDSNPEKVPETVLRAARKRSSSRG